MSAATATAAPRSHAAKRNVVLYMEGDVGLSPSWNFETVKDENTGTETKVLRVKGMPVFRTGTFRDSMGDQSTWDTVHIEQMVQNYTHLTEKSIFADVPVREGHGSFFGDPMTGLVGHHDGLATKDAVANDGVTYRYLLADFTLPTKEGQDKFLSGLWKNRSSEVGALESNEETLYYPVYQGFAFVDVPAVQYLNNFGKEKNRSFSILFEKENSVSGQSTTVTDPPTTIEPDGSAAPGTEPTGTPGDPTGGNTGTPAAPPAPVAAPAAVIPPAPTTQLSAPAAPAAPGVPQSFKCGGNDVSDFAAVQAYIASLETTNASFETFRTETIKLGRTGYVTQLAKDKKILGSQIEGFTALVMEMSDTQFASWKAVYDAAPEIPMLSGHGVTNDGVPGETDKSSEEKEYEQACARVLHHRASGLMQSIIETTDSYKKMVTLATKLGKDQV